MNRCCPNAVQESKSERVGLYWNEQGGFACLALLKITLSLHQCQRSHRWYNVYRGRTTPANTEETRSMQCTIWRMLWHGNMNVFWANAPSYDLNEVGLNTWFKLQLHIWLFKCPLFVLSKTEDSIVQTCMKMVQMDSLNFSDNFSYINYLIWGYGWISMIYWSLGHFLK